MLGWNPDKPPGETNGKHEDRAKILKGATSQKANDTERTTSGASSKRRLTEAKDTSKATTHTMFAQRCEVTTAKNLKRRYIFDACLELAAKVSTACIRMRPTLQTDETEKTSGALLAGVHCAFIGCHWTCPRQKRGMHTKVLKEDHPWDALLRLHVETEHGAVINELADVNHVELPPACSVWDVYKEAIAVRERQKILT